MYSYVDHTASMTVALESSTAYLKSVYDETKTVAFMTRVSLSTAWDVNMNAGRNLTRLFGLNIRSWFFNDQQALYNIQTTSRHGSQAPT